jgi:hypothetical protein
MERMPMKEMSLDCLTERHLLLFGIIIQWFARYEVLIQDVMATVAGSDLAAVILLTRNLDFSGKRRTLLELLRHWTIPLDQFDRISAYLMVPHTLMPLRNDIAHSAWISGATTHSIQPDWILRPAPGIKPLHNDPSAPNDRFVESDQEQFVYTLDSLNETVETLAENYKSFSYYLYEVGLIHGSPNRRTV